MWQGPWAGNRRALGGRLGAVPARLRPVLVFLAALAVYGVLAGPRLTRPSPDNHYSHLAQGWLSGRLDLGGRPPHRNDWGKVTELTLRDGAHVRGFACRTEACRARARAERVEVWRTTDGREVAVPRGQVVRRRATWYVTFPPAPAVLFLPGVMIWGLGFWDVLATVLLAAAIPAVLVAALDGLRGASGAAGREHLWLAAAWAVGSPACFVATAGGVWFTAQILGALLLVALIADAWDLRHPLRAGIWLALLLATRPPAALGGAVFLGLAWWRAGRSVKDGARIAIPVLLVAAALAWHNVARFGDPLEFGHRYLDVAWQPRIQEHGLFGLRYLGRNLHALLLLLPRWESGRLRVSIHGMSLLLAAPWILAWARAWIRPPRIEPRRADLALAAGVAAVPGLLYQNTGQLQFAPRFALDWLPFALFGIAMAGAARGRVFHVAVVLAAVVNLVGAWMFVRAPGHLFVHSQWPYGL